jgi:hypothetical protein
MRAARRRDSASSAVIPAMTGAVRLQVHLEWVVATRRGRYREMARDP